MVERMADLLTMGVPSQRQMAIELNTTHTTIKKYLPLARQLLNAMVPNRDDYRAEHIARLRYLCRKAMDDLDKCEKPYERAHLYRVVGQFMGQLALVTGLNVETTVNVEAQPLVIIRNPEAQQVKTGQDGTVVLKDASDSSSQTKTIDV